MTIAFIRTLILYILVITALRLMGKRQLGELSPSELAVTILISDLAAIPMQDPGISILNGIIPILTLLALEILISSLLLKSEGARKVLVGTGSLLIDNGVIKTDEIRRLRITLDELLEELRLKDFPDISYIKYAILETSGKISIIPTEEYGNNARCELPVTLISDGKANRAAFSRYGLDERWMKEMLNKHGAADTDEVLLMQYFPETERIILMKK